jgi:hypothetical protein
VKDSDRVARAPGEVRPRRAALDELRICYYNSEPGPAGKVWISCRRPALPGRALCHKHAGYHTRKLRRRARNKAARKTRKAARAIAAALTLALTLSACVRIETRSWQDEVDRCIAIGGPDTVPYCLELETVLREAGCNPKALYDSVNLAVRYGPAVPEAELDRIFESC